MKKKLEKDPFAGIPVTEDEICEYFMRKYYPLEKKALEGKE